MYYRFAESIIHEPPYLFRDKVTQYGKSGFLLRGDGRDPYAAYSGRFDPVELKMLYPRPAFIPDTGIFAQHHTFARYVDRTYLRPLMYILFTESFSFFVSKTYRHLPSGGIASGLAVVGKEHYIRIPQQAHIFDCRFVQFDHYVSLSAMYYIISITYTIPLPLIYI